MRIISAVHQLDDRIPDYFQRFIQRRAGKRQDIVSVLKLPIVAVTAYYWIDHPAADSWSGIHGIVDERRWIGGRGRLSVTKRSIGLKVEHLLVGCRWPFRQIAPHLSTCDEDAGPGLADAGDRFRRGAPPASQGSPP